MRLKVFLLFFVFFSLKNEAHSQKLGYPETVPPSAESVKLSEFALSPPNLYTGAMNQAVPIYSFDFDGAKIALSLQYHGGGVRAGENSGIVGLGWALSVPGSVSRVIQGYDDLVQGVSSQRDIVGYPYDLTPVPEKLNNPTSLGFDDPYWTNYLNLKRDTEPDVFNYNFLGSSGKFILGKKATANSPVTVVMLTKNQDKVVFDQLNQTLTITTPEGFSGLFDLKEYSTVISGNSPNTSWTYDGTTVDIIQTLKSGGRSVSAWHLTKITSPKGRELNLNYKINNSNKLSDYFTIGSRSWSEQKSVNTQLVTDNEDIKSWTRVINEHVYLESIVALDHDLKIMFNYISRFDLEKPDLGVPSINNWINAIKSERGNYLGTLLDPLRLNNIVINNNSGSNYLNFTANLYQNYFNENATDRPLFSRLKLDSVKVSDEVFKFKYFDGLPPKDTRGIDYWGFFNGKTLNQELTPVITNMPPIGAQLISYLTDNYYYQSENRSADFSYGKAGMLYEVILPTKGKSVFEYESHDYKLTGQESPPPSPGFISVSGISGPQVQPFNYVGFNVNGCTDITITLRARCRNFFQVPNCSIAPGDVNKVAAELVNSSGTVLHSITYSQLWANNVSSAQFQFTYPTNPFTGTPLPPGTYSLKVYNVSSGGVTQYYGDATVEFNSSCQGNTAPINIQRNQQAGGVRVKSITMYDQNGEIISKNRYEYFNSSMGSSFSTGKLMNPLRNLSQIGSANIDLDNSSNIITYTPGPVHFVHTSGSALSNGQAAQGSHIGYSFVREIFEGRNGLQNGLKTYTFSNTENVFLPMNASTNNFGVSMISSQEWNGANESKGVYTSTSSQVEFENTVYDYIRAPYINSLKLFNYGPSKPLVSFYKIPAGHLVPISKEVNQDGFVQKSVFEYSANNQLASVKRYDGATLIEEQRLKYPKDYSIGNTIISTLVNSNIIGSPSESIIYRNGSVVDASGVSYKLQNGKAVTDKQFIHNKSLTFVPTSNGIDFSGSYQIKTTVVSHDSYLNPTEIVSNQLESTSLIWDYNGVYPIAVASNCSPSELAFTSFETSNKGGWTFSGIPVSTFAKTGRKAYNLSNGAISKTGFGGTASNPFKVSFWARTVSGTGSVSVSGQSESISTTWKLVEMTLVSGTISISGTNIIIDELRLHPIDASVESFNYDPMLGIRSKSDTRNVMTYYDYDTRGRLTSIKDEDGNILEFFEYNYATGN